VSFTDYDCSGQVGSENTNDTLSSQNEKVLNQFFCILLFNIFCCIIQSWNCIDPLIIQWDKENEKVLIHIWMIT